MIKSLTKNSYPINFVQTKEINIPLLNYIKLNYYDRFVLALFGNFSKNERKMNIERLNNQIILDLFEIKSKFTEITVENNENINQIQEEFLAICANFKLSPVLGIYLKNTLKIEIENDLFSLKDEILNILTKNELLQNQRRIDLRKLDEVREIISLTDYLPTTHGSSVFQRGQTQVLNILTLGSSAEHMQKDTPEDFKVNYQSFFHHYNFPPFSVGETGKVGFTSRREIGHGNLAQKAIAPVLPRNKDFFYTIRLVSECLGSNGSTSMASTCASSLTLLSGGVKIRDLISGVAMGLALDEETGNYVVITDIQGWEDHFADMDFKVTGNEAGITAIQLDNKVGGLKLDILINAIEKAEAGRIHILNMMRKAINSPSLDYKENVPRMLFLVVPMDKMRDVIGSGGSVINGLEAEYGVSIDLENETGNCTLFGSNKENLEKCYKRIQIIIKDFKVGDEILAEVFRIESYGAFVKLEDSNKESMIHISNLRNGKERIEKVEDVVKIGDKIKVKVDSINNKGQLELILVK
jgi:polyribonucleotide nucleotidyltransferase